MHGRMYLYMYMCYTCTCNVPRTTDVHAHVQCTCTVHHIYGYSSKDIQYMHVLVLSTWWGVRVWLCSLFPTTHRVCAPGEDTSDQFSPHTPKLHTFPPSPLSPLSSLQVSVHHLPRLKHIPLQLAPCGNVIEKFHDPSLSRLTERLRDLSVLKSAEHLHQNPSLYSKSAECLKDVVMCSSGEKLKNTALSKSAERFRDLSTCSQSRLITPPHLIRHSSHPHSPSSRSPHTPHSPYTVTAHSPHLSTHQKTTPQETFPFSPPQPSPMSPKLLAGLGEPLDYHSLLDGALLDSDSVPGSSDSTFDMSDCCHGNRCGGHFKTSGDHSCSGSFCFESGCVREGGERGESGRGKAGGRGGEKERERGRGRCSLRAGEGERRERWRRKGKVSSLGLCVHQLPQAQYVCVYIVHACTCTCTMYKYAICMR